MWHTFAHIVPLGCIKRIRGWFSDGASPSALRVVGLGEWEPRYHRALLNVQQLRHGPASRAPYR